MKARNGCGAKVMEGWNARQRLKDGNIAPTKVQPWVGIERVGAFRWGALCKRWSETCAGGSECGIQRTRSLGLQPRRKALETTLFVF